MTSIRYNHKNLSDQLSVRYEYTVALFQNGTENRAFDCRIEPQFAWRRSYINIIEIKLIYHHLKWELFDLKWFRLARPPGIQITEKNYLLAEFKFNKTGQKFMTCHEVSPSIHLHHPQTQSHFHHFHYLKYSTKTVQVNNSSWRIPRLKSNVTS